MTKIEWTDTTWNPIVGCSVVSAGCTNCYAMRHAGRFLDGNPKTPHYHGTTQKSKAGPVWTGKVALAPENILHAPLRWKSPKLIFVNSMGDLFHESVPDEWIDQVFAVMALTPQHTYQLLTKRPDRMREYMTALEDEFERWERFGDAVAPLVGNAGYGLVGECHWPLPNVWLGVSVEDRQTMLTRGAVLKETPATVRFWSAEPLLEDLGAIRDYLMPDQIIVGGESGPGARPMHPDWARSIRDQCEAADVAFFFKQHGEFLPEDMADARGFHWQAGHSDPKVYRWPDGVCSIRIGKSRAGRLLDGREHNDFPQPVIPAQAGIQEQQA